ncbi:hypothetical protein HY837_05960 [archaeon]|nr:hypothetical protein [archaeon]
MAVLRLKTVILLLPFIFFGGAISSLFDKQWGPAGIGFVLSIGLFWFIYLKRR